MVNFPTLLVCMSSELVPEGGPGGDVEDRRWKAVLESYASGQVVQDPPPLEPGALHGILVHRTSQRNDQSFVGVAVGSEQEGACLGWGVEESLVLCLEM